MADFRPGIRAADERGAVAPLRDAGLTKAQVREASRRWGLPTWDKPAAACLSSAGWRTASRSPRTGWPASSAPRPPCAACSRRTACQDLRVRDLGDRASVEVDRRAAPAGRRRCTPTVRRARCATAGFDEVVVDEKGFRSGSMNERLG